MAYEAIPSSPVKNLEVLILGASAKDHSDFIKKLIADYDDTLLISMHYVSMHDFQTGEYQVNLCAIAGHIGEEEMRKHFDIVHAVIFVYDNNQAHEDRDELLRYWISAVEQHATRDTACFLVEINPSGTRQAGERDAPEGPEMINLFNSLPGAHRMYAKFYPSDEPPVYTRFRTSLVEAAARSYKAQNGCCGCS